MHLVTAKTGFIVPQETLDVEVGEKSSQSFQQPNCFMPSCTLPNAWNLENKSKDWKAAQTVQMDPTQKALT